MATSSSQLLKPSPWRCPWVLLSHSPSTASRNPAQSSSPIQPPLHTSTATTLVYVTITSFPGAQSLGYPLRTVEPTSGIFPPRDGVIRTFIHWLSSPSYWRFPLFDVTLPDISSLGLYFAGQAPMMSNKEGKRCSFPGQPSQSITNWVA